MEEYGYGEEESIPFVLSRGTNSKGLRANVLSTAGKNLLPFLTAKNVSALRGVSAYARNTVNYDYLGSKEAVIRGSLAQWRLQFPNARYANISGRNDLRDEDFLHLKGIKWLNMSFCNQPTITDAAFAHIKGVHTLYMSRCDQRTITNAAFAHIKGVHTLDMSWCWQESITDAAFAHIKGVHTLDMSWCCQPTITDAAFAHIKGVHTLNMENCLQAGITDAAFAHIKGVHTLYMAYCSRAITDAAFEHLRGIHTLDMSYCNQAGITGKTLYMLGDKLQILNIKSCNNETKKNANLFFGVTPLDPQVKMHLTPLEEEPVIQLGKPRRPPFGGRRTRKAKRKAKKTRRRK